MAIRVIYGAKVEQVRKMIANSEQWLEIIRAWRKERILFENVAGSLSTRADQRVKDLAEAIQLLVREGEAAGNAFELAKLVEGEAACLMEHLLITAGYRRELYERMLALCVYEGLKTLRKLLAKDFQNAIEHQLGDEMLKVAREVHSDVSELARRAEKAFEGVRNGIAAHREPERQTRDKLLETFVDWQAMQLSLATIDVLQPLTKVYLAYKGSRMSREEELSKKIMSMGDELRASGAL